MGRRSKAKHPHRNPAKPLTVDDLLARWMAHRAQCSPCHHHPQTDRCNSGRKLWIAYQAAHLTEIERRSY